MDAFAFNSTNANGLGLEALGTDGLSHTDQGCEAQAETWDEGMSRLLAELEGRVGAEQERGVERQVWNPDRWTWEPVAV